VADSQRKRSRRGRRIRPRREETIAALAAIVLFVLLFFPWYDISLTGSELSYPGGGVGRTAWEALDLIAPLLALACAVTLALVLARVLRPQWKPAISLGAAIAVAGGIASVLLLFRVVIPPDLDGLIGVEFDVTPNLGAFLALAAALGIAVGGYRTMRAEGSSFAAVADSLQPRRERPASRKR
jgi:hypothetical protein